MKKPCRGYAAGGVVDENRLTPQAVVPQEQLTKFIASVQPVVGPLPADTGLATEPFYKSAGMIGGPSFVSTFDGIGGANLPGNQPSAPQQIAQIGRFSDYTGSAASTLQNAARDDATKRIKNILSGPYRYDSAGNKKYLGGNPYAPGLISAATQPNEYDSKAQPGILRRRKPSPPAVPYGYETPSIESPFVGYKDGGVVEEDAAESLLRRMAAKYGVSNSLPEPSAPAPTVRKDQTVAASNEEQDRRRGFRTAARWREGGDYPIDVKKYAEGGIVSFKGKGGPREDKIPVTVAGEKIMVSDGEKAVILPAKTASNPAALGIIGGLIQHTNDGRAPNMGAPKRGGKYAAGLTPAQLAAELYAERTGQLPPPGPTPLPQSRGVTGSFQRGASGDFDLPPQRSAAPTAQEVYAPTYAALGVGPEQPPADPKAGNRLSSGTIGGSPFVRPIAASEQPPRQASANAGSWLPEGGVLRTPEGRQQVLEMLSGKGLRPDVGILGPRATLTSAISPLPQSIAAAAPNQRPQAAVTNRSGHGIAAPTVRQAGIAAALNRDSGARTIDGGMTVTQMGAGFDPTRLQMAPGYGMASNAAGKTIGGNMSPNQYVAADGTPGARWDETQQHKDAIAKNERMKLDLAEIQAGKRRGADPMAIQAATQGIASTMLGNQAKQEEMRRSDQSQALLQAAITTKDPAQHKAAIQNYLASRGVAMKDPDEWEIKDGGESTVPDGMGGVKVVKNPPVAFHKPTRQWIKSDGSVGQAGGIPTPDAEAIKRDVASGIAQGKSKTAMAERLVSMGLNPAEYGL